MIIELVGQVDENHQLHAVLPQEVPPGPVRLVVSYSETEEEDEMAWSRAIGQIWAEDWNDPREDIYTEEDGVPLNEPR